MQELSLLMQSSVGERVNSSPGATAGRALKRKKRDEPPALPRYVSAGVYGLTPRTYPVLQRCIDTGVSRMRNFQRELLKARCRIDAFSLGTVFDIDHRSDLKQAESFLIRNSSHSF